MTLVAPIDQVTTLHAVARAGIGVKNMPTAVFNFKLLPSVIREIKVQHLTGLLEGSKAAKTCQLYFNGGALIHAIDTSSDTAGDEVLYDLLNWGRGELKWTTLANLASQLPQTIDEDQENLFFTTLQLLLKQGTFEKEPAGWKLEQSASKISAPIVPDFPVTPQVTSSALPPLLVGQENPTLHQKLSAFDITELVTTLKEQFFSGYVTYRPVQDSDSSAFGAMLLFELGQITAARYATKASLLRGQAAYDAICTDPLPISRSISVAPPLVAAYRGLVEGFSPYSKLPATKENFRGLETAFSKQQRSGVIRFYLDAKLEVFYLIHQGQHVGTFGPQPLQPRLWRRLTPDLDIFWQNPAAHLDVYLTGQPELINVKPQDLAENSQLLALLNHSLQQLFTLVSEISAPKTAFEELIQVAKNGSQRFAALRPIADLKWDDDRNTLSETPSALKLQPAHLTQAELLATYQFLLDTFLAPYVELMGFDVFRQLAELALGSNRRKLEEAGVQLGFLFESSATTSRSEGIAWGELVPAQPTWADRETKNIATENNAFDF